jgi:hypothetical protein
MRIIAPMMILIMMTSTLAGCTGGDPDSGGGIDSDAVNELIDQNLQDFINNTTITVNQEIHHHYYNNSTVNEGDMTNNDYTVEYNNTTVIEGGEITNQNYDQSSTYYNASSIGGNGSSIGMVRTIDYVFDLDFLWGNSPIIPGDRDNIYNTNWSYYDYATNSYRNDVFIFDCNIYYLVGNSSTNNSNQETYWENNNWYDDAWSDNGYNNTMRDLFHNVAWNEDLRWICDENFYGNDDNQDYYNELIYDFTIPEGFVMMCLTDQSRPIIYQSNNYSSEGNNYEWTITNQVNTMYVDGMQYYCNNEMPPIGGEKDMIVSFSATYLQENYDYRLIWAYQLIPAASHDYNDLED